MVGTVQDAFGAIDILVNNAGVFHPVDVCEVQADELEAMIDTNLKGVLHCVQAVVGGMKDRRSGSILNISSIAGFGTSAQGTGAYALTKAAVNIMTKRLAQDLGPFDINVNCIAPGLIRTDMIKPYASTDNPNDENVEAINSRAMLHRIGEPEEIASAALFLVSDESSFITAQILKVDGGRRDYI